MNTLSILHLHSLPAPRPSTTSPIPLTPSPALFQQALLEMLEMLLVHAFYLLRAAGGWHCYTSLVRAIGTRDPSKSDWCSAACWSAAGTLRAPPGTRSSLEIQSLYVLIAAGASSERLPATGPDRSPAKT